MIFLAKAEILLLHARAIREFGGSWGLRDEGALESALVAAENRAYYDEADVVGCASSYAFHLTMAHAFVDGNKRVAAAATETFLVANEARFEATDDELYEFFMSIASGVLDRGQVEEWLRHRTRSP